MPYYTRCANKDITIFLGCCSHQHDRYYSFSLTITLMIFLRITSIIVKLFCAHTVDLNYKKGFHNPPNIHSFGLDSVQLLPIKHIYAHHLSNRLYLVASGRIIPVIHRFGWCLVGVHRLVAYRHLFSHVAPYHGESRPAR